MRGIGQRYQVARARKRYLPGPRMGGPGPLPWVALLAVIGTLVFLNGRERGETERAARRLERVRAAAMDPVELVATAARTHRVVILGDVRGSAASKRFAADVIEALARGPGLDIVALEVEASHQSRIDAYLAARDEDASLLLSRPRITREWEGVSRDFLEIYLRIRAVNNEVGAARRIRVVAFDAPGWPPEPPPSPARLVQQFGERAAHMARMLEEVLGRSDRARVLVIADGMEAVRGRLRVETGGEVLDSVPLLARRLESVSATRPFTILAAAPASAAPVLGLGGWQPGRWYESLGAVSEEPFGFLVTSALPVERDDLELWHAPGVSLEFRMLEPRPVDAWVRLPG